MLGVVRLRRNQRGLQAEHTWKSGPRGHVVQTLYFITGETEARVGLATRRSRSQGSLSKAITLLSKTQSQGKTAASEARKSENSLRIAE